MKRINELIFILNNISIMNKYILNNYFNAGYSLFIHLFLIIIEFHLIKLFFILEDSKFFSVEVNLHVSSKESEESWHSFSFDFSEVSSVEMSECFIEVLIKIIFSFFSLKP